jgi:hypothetical protein
MLRAQNKENANEDEARGGPTSEGAASGRRRCSATGSFSHGELLDITWDTGYPAGETTFSEAPSAHFQFWRATALAFYSEERGERRRFPRAPIPKTKILHPGGRSSMEKESLSAHEDTDVLLCLLKPCSRDISIVDKQRTFLLWYDNIGQLVWTHVAWCD